jgi:hypothetical protein
VDLASHLYSSLLIMKHLQRILWASGLFCIGRARSVPTRAAGNIDGVTIHSSNHTQLANGVKIYQSTPELDRQVRAAGVAEGWCGASTLEGVTSSNSPLISDCQAIIGSVYGLAQNNNAYFSTSQCGPDSSGQSTCYNAAVQYGSCMFGISTVNSGTDVSIRVGWEDVGDLITSSIALFGDNSLGTVGAQGNLECPEDDASLTPLATTWALYHSP